MWFSVFLILIAPAVGSFLAVLADRLPRGEDVVRAPSRCRGCARRIAPWDLIPIASFLMLRGRCRACGAAVPPMLFYAELLATGAAVLAVLAGGNALHMGLSALFLWILVALALSDLTWFRLPDPLTAGLVPVAFALAPQGLAMAALGAVLGAGSFALLRWGYAWLRGRAGLGMGDVKLMAGLGAYAGPFDLPLLVLMAALIGIAMAALTPGGLRGTRAVPFGTALCAAAALLWLMRV